MSINVVNIGSGSATGGGSITITIGAGGVPSGAHIIVAVSWDTDSTAQPTIADSFGNTYLISGSSTAQANNNVSGNGGGAIFRERTGGALSSGNVILIQPSGAVSNSAAAAFYVTGLANIGADAGSYNSSFGSSAAPSLTSGTPSFSGDLFVSIATASTTISSFTQDTTNANWNSTSPPGGSVSNTAPVLAVGVVVNAGSGTLKYAPTFGTSVPWAETVVGFAPPQSPSIAWEQQDQQARRSPTVTKTQKYAASGRSQFFAFPDMPKAGWEVQPPQPPHPRPENRAAAIMRGDDGTQAQFVLWKNTGWEVQPPQPPHPAPEKRAAAIMVGDTGIEAQKVNWFNAGWEVQPPQPPHPRSERSGATAVGAENIFSFMPPIINAGWEVQPPQPPHPRPEQRAAAIMVGDAGIEARQVNWFNTGWEVQPPPPPHPTPEKRAAAIMRGDDGIQDIRRLWFNAGWEVQPPQPPHPAPERRAAAVMLGDGGVQATFNRWFNAGWEVQPHQPSHPRPERSGSIAVGDPGTENILPVMQQVVNAGWEIQPLQPPHPTPEKRAAAIVVGDGGIQAAFNSWFNAGWEIQSPQPPYLRLGRSGVIALGDNGTQAQFVLWQNAGWEVQSHQPPHRRPERAGSIMVGDGGIENVYTSAAPQVINWGYDQTAIVLSQKVQRGLAAGGRSQFFAFPDMPKVGWEVQPPQPPHPRPERSGAIQIGDGGIENVYTFVPLPTQPLVQDQYLHLLYRLNRWSATKGRSDFAVFPPSTTWEWQTQSVQPPHPRSERSGAIAAGDSGIENVYIIGPPQVINWGYDQTVSMPNLKVQRGLAAGGRSQFFAFPDTPKMGWEIQPPQPPHPRPERSGAIAVGDSGTENVFSFVPPGSVLWGYEFQIPMQSSRPRPGSGAIMIGDSGTENVFTPPAGVLWGYEFQAPVTLPRPKRFGAIARGDDGIELTFQQWVNAGWEVQSPQPPHPRPERSGAIARGDDGVEFTFQQWINAGWEVQSVQPPYRPPQWRGSAWMRGDEGVVAPFTAWINYGWPIQPWQPPHFGKERAASWMRGDEGTQAKFVLFKPTDWPSPLVYPRPQYTKTGSASFMRGDDGIENQFVRFLPIWDNPVNIPITLHPRPERSGLLPPTTEQWQKVIVGLVVTFAGAGGLSVTVEFIKHICDILGPGVGSNPTEPPGSGANPSVSGLGVASNPATVGSGAKIC